MPNYQKNKDRVRYQFFFREKKTTSENMHVKDIKIFLKKKKIKNVGIVVNAIKTFSEDEKQRRAEQRRNY